VATYCRETLGLVVVAQALVALDAVESEERRRRGQGLLVGPAEHGRAQTLSCVGSVDHYSVHVGGEAVIASPERRVGPQQPQPGAQPRPAPYDVPLTTLRLVRYVGMGDGAAPPLLYAPRGEPVLGLAAHPQNLLGVGWECVYYIDRHGNLTPAVIVP
jgi:hypothetical protein